MALKQIVKKLLRKRGFAICNVRYPTKVWLEEIRQQILNQAGITCILDVGANVGQYARELRKSGYTGRVVSFEPLTEPYSHLTARFKDDVMHQAINSGLGADCSTLTMQVASDSASSSLYNTTDLFESTYEGSRLSHHEEVSILSLDTIWPDIVKHDDVVYLKIDTQGAELDVLRGAVASLPKISFIEVELSLVQLYKDQPLFPEVYLYLVEAGMQCLGIENEYMDQDTLSMFQVNAIFTNKRMKP